MVAIAPTQNDAQVALKAFLNAILPDDVEVIIALDNRVPEPSETRFVVMWPIRFMRLRTNIDSLADVKFTGSIAATVLTVSAVAFGTILDGALLFGTGITAGTTIVDQLTGSPGAAGTYTVSVSQTLTSRTLASGAKTLEQGAQITVQCDFHAADNTAADLAQTVSTVLRDESGVDLFRTLAPLAGVVPLYADDPRQAPFINEAQQFEWRWVLEVNLQVNQIVSLPAQFTDAVEIDAINVDAAYPP